jgi:hypothetical protein
VSAPDGARERSKAIKSSRSAEPPIERHWHGNNQPILSGENRLHCLHVSRTHLNQIGRRQACAVETCTAAVCGPMVTLVAPTLMAARTSKLIRDAEV